jgi:hypothetical protein
MISKLSIVAAILRSLNELVMAISSKLSPVIPPRSFSQIEKLVPGQAFSPSS